MKVSIEQCQIPPLQRLLQKVDEIFVESLKDQLKAEPTGPGVPPLALLCIDETSTERFREDLVQQYRYEVLRGFTLLKQGSFLKTIQVMTTTSPLIEKAATLNQTYSTPLTELPLYSEALAHIFVD